MKHLIQTLPKAELHVHIKGTFEPELMFQIAQRNSVSIPYANVDEVRAAYDFHNLQSFLDIYYASAKVLLHEQDFFDLTYAYLQKCRQDNVTHTEIFFDPQTHTERGVAFDLSAAEIAQLYKNSFQAAFLSDDEKLAWLVKIENSLNMN